MLIYSLMKLYIIGDMHFELSKDWSKEVFDKFLDWFDKIEFGKFEECELLQLGDTVEKASNLGDTIELLTRFFDIARRKFKTIYLLGGNHDHKMFKDKSQYATQFLSYFGQSDQIKNIFTESIFKTTNGFNIIALPYRRVGGKILDDYYSNDLPKEFYTTKADLICGHVALKEPKTFYGGINISNFATELKAFGHIHTRNGQFKNDYIGSILPFKIDEEQTELPRIIRCLDDKKNITQIEIPLLITYENLKFGDKPKYNKYSDTKAHIYTVTGCKNRQQAIAQYPDSYIRGVEKIINTINIGVGETNEVFASPLDALSNLIKETKITIKRKTLQLLQSLLS